jgi:hypothetical protein
MEPGRSSADRHQQHGYGHRLALGQRPGGHGAAVSAGGQALEDDVAVGHHATEPVVLPADRQGTDVECIFS